jgi:hypothetical protein
MLLFLGQGLWTIGLDPPAHPISLPRVVIDECQLGPLQTEGELISSLSGWRLVPLNPPSARSPIRSIESCHRSGKAAGPPIRRC